MRKLRPDPLGPDVLRCLEYHPVTELQCELADEHDGPHVADGEPWDDE